MTDDRRRGTDPLLQQLFDQNAEQHRQNTGSLNAIREALTALAIKDENHAGRIVNLEVWRDKTVDPFMALARDGFFQANVKKAGEEGEQRGEKKAWGTIFLIAGGIGTVFTGVLTVVIQNWRALLDLVTGRH
jgi:hypothetical protein